MNHTTNLHLPQWEATDRIMHGDFNDAFDKIDAALAAVPIVKLKDITMPSDAAQFSIDVSDINWSDYATVILYSDVLTAPNSVSNKNIQFSMTGCDMAAMTFTANVYDYTAGGLQIEFLHLWPNGGYVQFAVRGTSSYFNGNSVNDQMKLCSTTTAQGVTALNFASGTSGSGTTCLKGGSRFVLYGLKW